MTFSSGGFGTPAHLAGEMFKLQTGVRATHVPYQGLAKAIADLMNGTNQYQFITPLPVMELIAAGKLRALAVTGPERLPALKDVPTVGEAGFPDLIIQDWFGILVKTGTPDAIVVRLNEAMNKALAKPRVREALEKMAAEPAGGTPAEFGAFLKVADRPLGQGRQGFRDQDVMSSDFRVTLLGTGVPIPSPDRFGPCTLVEAGDQKFLVDAGRGATIRLYQLKIPIGRIDVQLLTHYHSDHTSCLPDVWLTGWLESHFGTRKTPYRVIGPTGARRLIENLERAYEDDIKIRVTDEKLPLSGIATAVTEYNCDGPIYEKDGVKVIAFEVDHGDVIKPCYGYRFEYGGRVAVLSSDTRYNENVIKYGRGADLLVHEVASARPELMKEAYIQRIVGHHTTPHDCGRVFAQTRPKLAAFTHIVQLASPTVKPPSIDEMMAETRQTYDGPLVMGEDLMSFEIGDTVTVKRLMPQLA